MQSSRFDQILTLTLANLKSRYRNTILGFAWVIMNPIMLYGAQSYAFSYILKIDVSHYHLFLVTGLLPWIFLTQTIEMNAHALLTSSRVLKSLPIHPAVVLSANVFDNFINFIAAFTLLLIPFYLHSNLPLINLLLFPFPIFTLLVGVTSLSFLISILQVFYRDSKFVVTFLLSISFYLTPTFYPEGFVPESMRWIIDWNLLYLFIKPFRFIFSDDPSVLWLALAKVLIFDLALIGLCMYVWKRKRNKLYYYLS